jgi:DNA polymerase I-like protein with 3'-5' exonuclease and polymerase domains
MKLIFDIETDDLNATKVWCLVAKEVNGESFRFGPDKIEEGLDLLKSAELLIGHNIIGFDLPVLKRLYDFNHSGKIIDTLVMSRLYNPVRENGHSLKTWGYRLGVYKQEQPEFQNYSPKMLNYCEQDVILNEAVYKHLVNEGMGFSKQSFEIEQMTASIMNEQEQTGFYFDTKQAMTLLSKLKQKMSNVEDEVQQTFKPKWIDDKQVLPYIKKNGELSKRGLTDEEYESILISGNHGPFIRKKLVEFNLGSRKQIGEYLIDFGWQPERFTPTGQPIVDEGTLKKITHIKEAKLIADYLLYQKRIAQVSSWIDELKEDRVHGRVIPNGTITGRMTHRNPNMAQVPNLGSPYGKECRACWTVPEGYKLVGIDASGLELRMLAHYMNDADYIEEVINGDIHSTNQELAGLKTRDQAKTFIYALVYGAGDAKIGKIINGDIKKGKQLKERFYRNLPALKKLRDRVQQASNRGYLKGIDGRKIYVRSQHSALNTLLQGSGAIVMKQAMINLYLSMRLNSIDANFVANIHDEWQLQVKESQADYIGRLGVESIEKVTEQFNMRCDLTGQYKIGGNWSETH